MHLRRTLRTVIITEKKNRHTEHTKTLIIRSTFTEKNKDKIEKQNKLKYKKHTMSCYKYGYCQ